MTSPPLDREQRWSLLHQMTRIRRFEERCVELYSATKIRGFLHLYIGEEAVATGVIDRLRDDDAVVTTYRDHGHALAKGVPMRAVMAEMFGKEAGCSRGRGGSMHLFDAARGFYGGNAIVGGHLPVSTGLGWADARLGRDRVTVCFFGEGAVAEGEFHEAMNLAALWDLPVLFACENNLYAMGTALERSEADTDLTTKAASYAMAAWSVDGMDVEAVADATDRALTSIRAGGGPVFLELQTFRFRAHSMYDPDRYREADEIERWKERDPLVVLGDRLREADPEAESRLAAIEAEVGVEIDDAVAFAEAAEVEPIDHLTRWVYADESTVVGAGGARR
jgi:pyruvate dehydrogenase E1 component alpha subunit